jgi:serralysin
MPAVTSYNPTGNTYIDGLLDGTKWAVNSFTFSFPTRASFYQSGYGDGEPLNNFGALNTAQQAAVRSALTLDATVANISFHEIAETATQHADLRYAQSDAPSTAWGYYPSPIPEGGDVWVSNASGWYDNPIKGSYGYATFIHETGHALGLKHPHEIEGAFGAMPLARDTLEYTVMSYRSYAGASSTTGYTNGDFDYPQSLMMEDIRAIQQLYGANFSTHAEDLSITHI